eukprot:954317-Amphidinium_carterae.1
MCSSSVGQHSAHAPDSKSYVQSGQQHPVEPEVCIAQGGAGSSSDIKQAGSKRRPYLLGPAFNAVQAFPPPDLARVIETTAFYVARSGEEFKRRVVAKSNADNTPHMCDFMEEGHTYYEFYIACRDLQLTSIAQETVDLTTTGSSGSTGSGPKSRAADLASVESVNQGGKGSNVPKSGASVNSQTSPKHPGVAKIARVVFKDGDAPAKHPAAPALPHPPKVKARGSVSTQEAVQVVKRRRMSIGFVAPVPDITTRPKSCAKPPQRAPITLASNAKATSAQTPAKLPDSAMPPPPVPDRRLPLRRIKAAASATLRAEVPKAKVADATVPDPADTTEPAE